MSKNTSKSYEVSRTDDEVKQEIATRIKQRRRSMRKILTTEAVAEKLEISRVAYSHIENGKNNVNGVTLWKLSVLFGCRVEDFFPKTPSGYALSPNDLEAIEHVDQDAARWAEELFGGPQE